MASLGVAYVGEIGRRILILVLSGSEIDLSGCSSRVARGCDTNSSEPRKAW